MSAFSVVESWRCQRLPCGGQCGQQCRHQHRCPRASKCPVLKAALAAASFARPGRILGLAVGREWTGCCERAAHCLGGAGGGAGGTGWVFLLSSSTWRVLGVRSGLCSWFSQRERALLLESWGEDGNYFLVIARPYKIEVWWFLLEQPSLPKSYPAPACTALGWSASKGRDVLQGRVSPCWLRGGCFGMWWCTFIGIEMLISQSRLFDDRISKDGHHSLVKPG